MKSTPGTLIQSSKLLAFKSGPVKFSSPIVQTFEIYFGRNFTKIEKKTTGSRKENVKKSAIRPNLMNKILMYTLKACRFCFTKNDLLKKNILMFENKSL